MTAYNVRKKSLLSRARKAREKQERVRAQAGRYADRAKMRNTLNDRDDDEEEEEDQVDDRVGLAAPSVTVPPPQQRESPSATGKKPSPKHKSPRPVLSSSFQSLESMQADTEAAEVFEAFRKDLAYWWKTNPTKRGDEDLRGDLADDLTERYLCQRLDPLPSSRVVTNIRKTVAQIIEEFAGEGKVPLEISGDMKAEDLVPVTKFAQEKAANEAKQAAETAHLAEIRKREIQDSAAKRAEAEKKRIKEQYEQYMALKNKAMSHADNEKEKEIETHLDDIRSLISSIKTRGT